MLEDQIKEMSINLQKINKEIQLIIKLIKIELKKGGDNVRFKKK